MRFSTLVCLVLAAAPLHAHDDDPKILDKKPRYEGEGYRRNLALTNAIQKLQAGAQTVGGTTQKATTEPDFPSNGVTLLSWLPLGEFGEHASGNDCWGYVSSSGREYAIIGLSAGTGFVEITDPGDAQIVSVHPGPTSLWRDVKTYQDYAYAVSEGGDGIQVFHLGDIDEGIVTFVGSVTAGPTNVTVSHNVAIDEVSGYLYRAGGSSHGLRMYSLANPASPSYVGKWDNRYVHDAQVVTYTSGPYAGRQIAFACSGFDFGQTNTGLDIIDVTNKNNPINLANIQYSNAEYSHQGWLSEDRQYFYLNDELDGQARTVVFDVSNLNSPVEVANYPLGSSAITHNLYTHQGKAYHANYTTGLQIFDLSNPTAPGKASSFDTSPTTSSSTFNGLWSVYPYFPSGTVIGSDIERGLFVWNVGSPQLTYSFPEPLTELVPPQVEFDVEFDISETGGSLEPGTVELYADSGSGFVSVPVTDLGGGSYGAVLGGMSCSEQTRYFMTAKASNGVTWTSPKGAPGSTHVTTAVLTETAVADYKMEAQAGWTKGAPDDDATSGIWQRGNPIGTEAQPEVDHTPNSFLECWVTGNAAGPNGSPGLGDDDVDDGKTTLFSPIIDMAGLDDALISYWRWFSNNTGGAPNEDVFRIYISSDGGTNWTLVEEVGPTGPETNGGWLQHQFLVADFVPLTSQMKMRFVASDEGAGSIVEAALDDLVVTGFRCNGLEADVASVSVSAGSTQALSLNVGDAFAGQRHWLVGTTSGTAPGVPLGEWLLPLNPDFYFNLTVAGPNLAPLGNSLGLLNGAGEADATFGLAPGTSSSVVGLTLHHAFVVLDVNNDDVLYASNAVAVTLTP